MTRLLIYEQLIQDFYTGQLLDAPTQPLPVIPPLRPEPPQPQPREPRHAWRSPKS
ncbi:hypothetical protein [Actinomycetospora sp. CA-053990]|uniref:hypothetical protein n=1 Tax=Actinomycetospora sp. CA-053990 TaxID=3239891 RepID=UPI003D8A6848